MELWVCWPDNSQCIDFPTVRWCFFYGSNILWSKTNLNMNFREWHGGLQIFSVMVYSYALWIWFLLSFPIIISCSLIPAFFVLKPMFPMKNWWIIAAHIWCKNFQLQVIAAAQQQAQASAQVSRNNWIGQGSLTNGSWKWWEAQVQESTFTIADFQVTCEKLQGCATILRICSCLVGKNVHFDISQSVRAWCSDSPSTQGLDSSFAIALSHGVSAFCGGIGSSLLLYLARQVKLALEKKAQVTNFSPDVFLLLVFRWWWRSPVVVWSPQMEWPSSEKMVRPEKQTSDGRWAVFWCTFFWTAWTKIRWRVYTRGCLVETFTGWWFQIFLIFTPPIWGRFPILTNIFQRGWNHQLVQIVFMKLVWSGHACFWFWIWTSLTRGSPTMQFRKSYWNKKGNSKFLLFGYFFDAWGVVWTQIGEDVSNRIGAIMKPQYSLLESLQRGVFSPYKKTLQALVVCIIFVHT